MRASQKTSTMNAHGAVINKVIWAQKQRKLSPGGRRGESSLITHAVSICATGEQRSCNRKSVTDPTIFPVDIHKADGHSLSTFPSSALLLFHPFIPSLVKLLFLLLLLYLCLPVSSFLNILPSLLLSAPNLSSSWWATVVRTGTISPETTFFVLLFF